MARYKEICVVLLDVGSRSNPLLEDAKVALVNFLTSKMIFKASHEVAIYLYGTAGTNNHLNREFAGQGESLYLNITEMIPMSGPVPKQMDDIQALQPEDGNSDFMDALTTAIDLVYRVVADRPELEKATVTKRIVLVSGLLNEVTKDEGFESFQSELESKMEAAKIRLDVCCLREQDAKTSAAHTDNLSTLRSMARGQEPVVAIGSMEIRSLFPIREYSATAYYSGPLLFGENLAISVKATKKVSQERLPGLNRFSDQAKHDQGKHTVSTERSFKKPDAEAEGEGKDDVYAPEDMGKAYQYGGQIVPMAREQELALKYSPDKGFSVLAVVPQKSVSHALWTGDTWCVAPEKGNEDSFRSLSAIIYQLQAADSALLTRYVPRAGGEITLGFLTPGQNGENAQKCLFMHQLPYEADVRAASFTTFSKKPEVLPTKQQSAVIDQVLETYDLDKGVHEVRRPEMTGSPILHRFLQIVIGKATKTDLSKESEIYVGQVVDGSHGPEEAFAGSLAALKDKFTLESDESQVEETAPKRAVEDA